MIADLELPSLELHRQHSKLMMMMFWITYGLVDIPASLHLRQSTTSTHGHGLEDMDGTATPSSSLERVCGINYRRL